MGSDNKYNSFIDTNSITDVSISSIYFNNMTVYGSEAIGIKNVNNYILKDIHFYNFTVT
jgi:hypothetical protein